MYSYFSNWTNSFPSHLHLSEENVNITMHSWKVLRYYSSFFYCYMQGIELVCYEY